MYGFSSLVVQFVVKRVVNHPSCCTYMWHPKRSWIPGKHCAAKFLLKIEIRLVPTILQYHNIELNFPMKIKCWFYNTTFLEAILHLKGIWRRQQIWMWNFEQKCDFNWHEKIVDDNGKACTCLNCKKLIFIKVSKRLRIEIRIFSEKSLKKVRTSKLESGKKYFIVLYRKKS